MAKGYLLELIIFICGAVLMSLELVGSRVLAPYLGTSIIVWTSLIGVILGSLSLGYYFGGKISDIRPSYRTLSYIILGASICITLTAIINSTLLLFLQVVIPDLYIRALIATCLLFTPASVALGMVSPYAVKLKVNSLTTSGSTVGRLYAISTVGSIVGTFVGGFLLVSFIGTLSILYILAIILLLTALLTRLSDWKIAKKLWIILVFFLTVQTVFLISPIEKHFIDVDTAYSRVWIYNAKDKAGKEAKYMVINDEMSSAMYLTSNELVFDYTRFYRLVDHFIPNVKTGLLIGGAGYSYPKDFLQKHSQATLDVVEIDPEITDLARKYFNLKDDLRLTIYHEDGRTFLNQTKNKYDVIFGDAFKSYSPPYNLTTYEAVSKMYSSLNSNGVVIVNVISSIDDEKGQFFRAEYATFKSIFPQVYVFPVQFPDEGEKVQNIMIVALKSPNKPLLTSSNKEHQSYLSNRWKGNIQEDVPVLTDDFSPIEKYIAKLRLN